MTTDGRHTPYGKSGSSRTRRWSGIDGGIVVLENLTYIRQNMDDGSYMNPRLHRWALRLNQSQSRGTWY